MGETWHVYTPVAFGQRTGENHHTYGTLLQVSFATWASLFISIQSSTILLYLTLALVKGMLCLFTYTGPKIYRKLSYFDPSGGHNISLWLQIIWCVCDVVAYAAVACFLRVWWRWRWRCSINDSSSSTCTMYALRRLTWRPQ